MVNFSCDWHSVNSPLSQSNICKSFLIHTVEVNNALFCEFAFLTNYNRNSSNSE